MYRIVLFALFSAIISATDAADYQDCGSELGKIERVNIVNCDFLQQNPCRGKPGEYFTIGIEFSVLDDIDKVTANGYWNDKNIHSNDDVCHTTGSGIEKCPISKTEDDGDIQLYYGDIETEKNWTKGKANVKWELKDGDSRTIVCAIVSITLN